MAQSNHLDTITQGDAELAAEAATKNDLSKLTPDQRSQLYGAVCKSMGLNPLTSPFEYITLNSKLTLYAKKGATDQLRKINGVSITGIEEKIFDGILMVTATAKDATGRTDTEIGAVSIGGLKGEALANAYMKAITKAKRRVTLSISGLGWLDESEVESIPGAQATLVDKDTGEISSASVDAPALPRQISAPKDDAERAMRRVHAAASIAGIDDPHTILHAWAIDSGYTSLKDVPGATLDRMSRAFEDRPESARTWAQTYQQEQEHPHAGLSDEEAIEVALADATPVTDGQLPGMDDPELDRNLERIADLARS